jgi:hypothetical protein
MRASPAAFLLIASIFAPGVLRAAAPPAQPALVNLAERVEELKDLKWGMFICWSFSTYSGTKNEWTPGITDLSLFAAKDVDTDAWARTAADLSAWENSA